jgi:hypothetical protein
MELIDSAGEWGGTWTVVRPNRKRTQMAAATVEAKEGALVFRAEEGTLLLALGPGEWLELQRSVADLPNGAQVFERSR